MPRFLRLLPLLFLAGFAAPCRAALIQTYDLTTLCFLSMDVVEARLTRHHLPGQEDWKDTFTATVLNPLEGKYKAGDRISRLDCTLYNPAQTGQHCLLFLTSAQEGQDSLGRKLPPVHLVDMLLIDSQSRVRRYFQWSDPGGLAAEGYIPPGLPEQSGLPQQRFPTLTEARKIIASKWTASKKMKTPPYQVLHQH